VPAIAVARHRVDLDEDSALRSGVMITPTFFINGRRYDGPWDEATVSEALLGSVGHRVRTAALDFSSWPPSSGVALLLMSILAVLLTNSIWAPAFKALWGMPLSISVGDHALALSLLHWINDGFLTLFFLVVGLEIKQEFTVGRLATRQSAALPIAAALGGMIVPALLYAALVPAGPWQRGWGVPMATDTAFAVALIAMMGRRVPPALRIFLTAAAIVDDLGAIVVVAIFYSEPLQYAALAAAAVCTGLLALLNYWRVYRLAPYIIVGACLWFAVHASGLHATLSGVILALFIPTRPPPNLDALMAQANTLVDSEFERHRKGVDGGLSLTALEALDEIHDRLESPASRVLRWLALRSSFLILPVFALANSGVALSAGLLDGRAPLVFGIGFGLMIGKPIGLVLASLLAVRSGLATKPPEYTWRQLCGAGALAGIGFTMSLFIAEQAFITADDFAAAKLAVFSASILSALVGVAVLWNADTARAAPGRAA
jgi:NhaA family Na+:H+ antiporter